MMKFEGKVSLVTGASQGIGLAIARRFVEAAGGSLQLLLEPRSHLAEGCSNGLGRSRQKRTDRDNALLNCGVL